MKKILGDKGELLATEYLKKKGFKILEQNFSCKLGEIDLVCKDGDVIVIVEVKTRVSMRFGQPFEAVTYSKQQRLIRLAWTYAKYRYQRIDMPMRFDVVSIVLRDNIPNFHHIQNAIF